MSNVNNVYWFIFFNDQLLLQKKGETYTIPYSINPPVPVKNVLEVSLLEDMPACTASVDTPLERLNPFRWVCGHPTITSILSYIK